MAALVTLEEAKVHLHLEQLETPERDADITATLEMASAIIIDYLDVRADDTWTPETVPLVVKAAVLDELAYRFAADRGDHPVNNAAHVERRKQLLARWHDAAVA